MEARSGGVESAIKRDNLTREIGFQLLEVGTLLEKPPFPEYIQSFTHPCLL
jgi:hypothetical protein